MRSVLPRPASWPDKAISGLVGGSYNGERTDLLVFYSAGGQLLQGAYRPVWERRGSPGMVLGSLGAFVVLEARRSRRTTWSMATGTPCRRAFRPVGPPAGRNNREPRPHVAGVASLTSGSVQRRSFGGDRDGTWHERGTRLARKHAGVASARNRQPGSVTASSLSSSSLLALATLVLGPWTTIPGIKIIRP